MNKKVYTISFLLSICVAAGYLYLNSYKEVGDVELSGIFPARGSDLPAEGVSEIQAQPPERIDLPIGGHDSQLRFFDASGQRLSDFEEVVVFYIDEDSSSSMVSVTLQGEIIEPQSQLGRATWLYVEHCGTPYAVLDRDDSNVQLGESSVCLVRARIREFSQESPEVKIKWMRKYEKPYSVQNFQPVHEVNMRRGSFAEIALDELVAFATHYSYARSEGLAWSPIVLDSERPSVAVIPEEPGGDLAVNWFGAGVNGRFEMKIISGTESLDSRTLSGSGSEYFRGLPARRLRVVAGFRHFNPDISSDILIDKYIDLGGGEGMACDLDFGELSSAGQAFVQVRALASEEVVEDWFLSAKGRYVEILAVPTNGELDVNARPIKRLSQNKMVQSQDPDAALESAFFLLNPGRYVVHAPLYGVAHSFHTDDDHSAALDLSEVRRVKINFRDASSGKIVFVDKFSAVVYYECEGQMLHSALLNRLRDDRSHELLTAAQLAQVTIRDAVYGRVERTIAIDAEEINVDLSHSREIHIMLVDKEHPRGMLFSEANKLAYFHNGVEIESVSPKFMDLSEGDGGDFMCARVAVILEGVDRFEVRNLPPKDAIRAFELPPVKNPLEPYVVSAFK
jgi:hypothetical protein